MSVISRKQFLIRATGSMLPSLFSSEGSIMTVTGAIRPDELGITLAHEHILVDFIGADRITDKRWNRDAVAARVLPYLLEAKKEGVRSFVECTPAYLGRDPLLLQSLSRQTGIRFITNTGYYGAVQNKYLPAHALNASEDELASTWIAEYKNGIGKTGIKPGFIKIGIDADDKGLSTVHQKLIRAAGKTHKQTGLTIYSHTGKAAPALEQIDLLIREKVSPQAFVWVHAQAEKDQQQYLAALKTGAWVSLDGMTGDYEDYVRKLVFLKANGWLHKVLISHDAGWYRPGEVNGGEIHGYTDIFKHIKPALRVNGFTEDDINQLIIRNPADALTIRIRH